MNTTGSTRLDFDIEDSDLADTSATSLRDQALAALQAQDPAVQVDFTLGVDANGLPTGSGSEYAVLQDAKAKGVKVSVVNIMTMDFYDGSNNDLGDAESAAKATAGQLSSLYGISTSAAYNMMGLTPIAGVNDDGTDFSISNASSLESFAASNGVEELSFWEVDGYDKGTGYQYSSIFNKITGGSGGTPSASDREHRADHRVRGPVPGRPLGQHRRLQPDPGLHLQRHQRAELDREQQRHPDRPGRLP